ncbi:hypothetical protein [Paenibacillus agilis]|uniref:Uncharacterized protein n=1 Tax=Paenibacillus agilis TaxID=3020863 RepID=A0A559IEN9_9BACL|nr:hypothetical protein [Paenibacillus agilis]TVX85980.1 hypothetical protein FPZ44_23815 [Paenibacillus agilis]
MKIFTTAEMVERIDIAQKAEMIEPVQDIIVQRKSEGIVVLKDAMSTKHIGQWLPLSHTVLGAKWVLERKEIPFLRAVELIRQGRTVSCEYDGRPPVVYDSLDDLIHLYEIVEGKWYLED